MGSGRGIGSGRGLESGRGVWSCQVWRVAGDGQSVQSLKTKIIILLGASDHTYIQRLK